jgi:hypothetical protein
VPARIHDVALSLERATSRIDDAAFCFDEATIDFENVALTMRATLGPSTATRLQSSAWHFVFQERPFAFEGRRPGFEASLSLRESDVPETR